MRRRRAAGKVIEVIKADWHGRRDQRLAPARSTRRLQVRRGPAQVAAARAGSQCLVPGRSGASSRDRSRSRSTDRHSSRRTSFGIDAVLVLDPGGTKSSEGVTFELSRRERHPPGAAGLDELLRRRHPVQQDRLRRPDQAGPPPPGCPFLLRAAGRESRRHRSRACVRRRRRGPARPARSPRTHRRSAALVAARGLRPTAHCVNSSTRKRAR